MDVAQTPRQHGVQTRPHSEGNGTSSVRRVASTFAREGRYEVALRHLIAAGDRVAAEFLLVAQPERLGLPNADGHLADRGAAPVAALAWREGLSCYLSGERCDAALFERVPLTPEGNPDDVQALCLATVWYRALGMQQASRSAAARAERIGRSCADPVVRAAGHRSMALLAAHDGDHHASQTHYRAALELAPTDDNLLRIVMGLNRACHALAHGAPAAAVHEIEEALRLGRAAAITSFEAFGLSVSAAAKTRLGRLEEALADAAAGQRLRHARGVCFDTVFGLLALGNVHRRRREPRQAREALEAAQATVGDAPDPLPLLVETLAALAVVRAADDPDIARKLAERAVLLGSASDGAHALLARGWVSLVGGDREGAARDAAEARTAASVGHDHAALAEALELGVLATPTPKTVAGLLDDAVALYQVTGDRSGEARVRLVAAKLGGGNRGGIEPEEEKLRRYGVRLDSFVADALTALGSAPRLTVRALGDFQVLRGGVGVPVREWQSKQARDLLKILIAQRGRPVPRHRVMEWLWPDQAPARTGNRLSVLLSTLRRVLDPERRIGHPGPIVADRSSVAVDLAVVDVDVESFLASADSALAAHRAGRTEAVALLAAAEQLYGGEFLSDDPYEEWAQPVRDEARTAYAALLRALAGQMMDTDQKLSYLLRLIHLDSYDEDTHLELVQGLHEAGRHGEANRRYRDYVERMNELGVEPAPPRHLPDPNVGARPRAPRRQLSLT